MKNKKASVENTYKFALEENQLKDNSMKLVRVEGTPVLLVKQGCQIFAFDNRCPHMGCSFFGGTLEGFSIICPCHDWRFNLQTGEYEKEKSIKLVTFKWKLSDGRIWVDIPE